MAVVTWHQGAVTKELRAKAAGHKSVVVWFTGLSGSGKSTLAVALEEYLFQQHFHTYRLDGDNIRHGLNADLDFSPAARKENIRRLGEVGKLFVDAGIITLTAFISPYRADRDAVRSLLAPGEFVEVYVQCAVTVCEQRDTKGLYAQARAGQIKDFTGISAPYEESDHPEIIINTETATMAESLDQLIRELKRLGYIS